MYKDYCESFFAFEWVWFWIPAYIDRDIVLDYQNAFGVFDMVIREQRRNPLVLYDHIHRLVIRASCPCLGYVRQTRRLVAAVPDSLPGGHGAPTDESGHVCNNKTETLRSYNVTSL